MKEFDSSLIAFILSQDKEVRLVDKKHLKSKYEITLKSFLMTESFEVDLYFWEAEYLEKVAFDRKGIYANEVIEIRNHYTNELEAKFQGEYLREIKRVM